MSNPVLSSDRAQGGEPVAADFGSGSERVLPTPLEQVFFRSKEDLARQMMANAEAANRAASGIGYRTKPLKNQAHKLEREAAVWRQAAQLVMSIRSES